MLPKLMHIGLFVAVYEEGSFTAAASREGLGQSGVSAHVRQLETQLGVQLFARDRAIVPTPAGHAYYRQCVQLLRTHAAACHAVGRRAEQPAGALRIGMIPTMSRSVFSRALRAFEAAYPAVSIQLTEGGGSVIATAVRRGMLDFGIVQRMPDDGSGTSGLRTSLFTRSPAFACATSRTCTWCCRSGGGRCLNSTCSTTKSTSRSGSAGSSPCWVPWTWYVPATGRP